MVGMDVGLAAWLARHPAPRLPARPRRALLDCVTGLGWAVQAPGSGPALASSVAALLPALSTSQLTTLLHQVQSEDLS